MRQRTNKVGVRNIGLTIGLDEGDWRMHARNSAADGKSSVVSAVPLLSQIIHLLQFFWRRKAKVHKVRGQGVEV